TTLSFCTTGRRAGGSSRRGARPVVVVTVNGGRGSTHLLPAPAWMHRIGWRHEAILSLPLVYLSARKPAPLAHAASPLSGRSRVGGCGERYSAAWRLILVSAMLLSFLSVASSSARFLASTEAQSERPSCFAQAIRVP